MIFIGERVSEGARRARDKTYEGAEMARDKTVEGAKKAKETAENIGKMMGYCTHREP